MRGIKTEGRDERKEGEEKSRIKKKQMRGGICVCVVCVGGVTRAWWWWWWGRRDVGVGGAFSSSVRRSKDAEATVNPGRKSARKTWIMISREGGRTGAGTRRQSGSSLIMRPRRLHSMDLSNRVTLSPRKRQTHREDTR